MKTAQEIKRHYYQVLCEAIQRPTMYGGSSDHGIEQFFYWLFDLLCLIDEKEDRSWLRFLSNRSLNGSGIGFLPAIKDRFFGFDAWVETSALAAEFAFLSGFLTVERFLTTEKYSELISLLKGRNRQELIPCNEAEIYPGDSVYDFEFLKKELLPLAALQIKSGDGSKEVYCFLAEDQDRPWVYLDRQVFALDSKFCSELFQLRSYSQKSFL